jgi:hypothetical protein
MIGYKSNVLPCVFSDFRLYTNDTFRLFGFYSVWTGSLLPMSWGVLREGFNPEDGSDRLSRNVIKQSTLRKISNVLVSFLRAKRTSSWNLLVLHATLRMIATGLSETSINSNPMTQLHMPSRRESSVTAM